MGLRVLGTGGTIASRLDPQTGAVVPALAPEDLLAAVPSLDDLGPITVEEIDRVNGWNVTPQTMLAVARRTRRALEDGEGVVVTHGTDTIEETCYLVDLLAGAATAGAGCIFACAMRSAGEVGADGPRNLLAAARTALDPGARGRGALLTANDELHCARWVTKTDTTHIATFRSPGGGPVGRVEPGGIRFTLPTPGRPPAGDDIDPHVATVWADTGMDDGLLRWLVDERGVHGLVLVGTGAGHVPGAAVPGVEHAVQHGVPVVVASRCWTGRVTPIYGGPGGGVTLRDLGVIGAGDLPPGKARVALMVALGVDRDPDAVRKWFADV